MPVKAVQIIGGSHVKLHNQQFRRPKLQEISLEGRNRSRILRLETTT